MGLDMYLARRQQFGGFSFETQQSRKFKQVRLIPTDGDKEQVINLSEPAAVVIEVNIAYWRKANAIHRWFIENCTGGEDDLKPVEVDIDDLRALKELCEEVKQKAKTKLIPAKDGSGEETLVITNASVLAKLLPTQNGFFFGSTEYDKWYLQDIDYTIEQFGKIISEHEKLVASGAKEYSISYEYLASW